MDYNDDLMIIKKDKFKENQKIDNIILEQMK